MSVSVTRPVRRHVLAHILLIAASLVMLYPMLWMVSCSFREEHDILTNISLIPTTFTLEPYRAALGNLAGSSIRFTSFFANSAVIALISVVGTVLSTTLTAYALARIRFAGRNFWFAMVIGSLLLPEVVVRVPQFIMFHKIGWVGSILPLTVPKFFAVTSFFVFMMVQFIRAIPHELDESAFIDGASHLQVYWKIIMPLSTASIVTVVIFAFIWSWNDFLGPLIYLNNMTMYTVPLGLMMLREASYTTSFGMLMAVSTLSLLPVFFAFMVSQQFLVEGIQTTGFK